MRYERELILNCTFVNNRAFILHNFVGNRLYKLAYIKFPVQWGLKLR